MSELAVPANGIGHAIKKEAALSGTDRPHDSEVAGCPQVPATEGPSQSRPSGPTADLVGKTDTEHASMMFICRQVYASLGEA
jgi:hypothetical protein